MDTTTNQGPIPLLKWKTTRVLVVSGTMWENIFPAQSEHWYKRKIQSNSVI